MQGSSVPLFLEVCCTPAVDGILASVCGHPPSLYLDFLERTVQVTVAQTRDASVDSYCEAPHNLLQRKFVMLLTCSRIWAMQTHGEVVFINVRHLQVLHLHPHLRLHQTPNQSN